MGVPPKIKRLTIYGGELTGMDFTWTLFNECYSAGMKSVKDNIFYLE